MKKLFVTMSALCVALSVGAQKQMLSLQKCLEMAQKQNYAVLAGTKSVERAKAMQGTAWDVDKTDLTLGQDPTSGGSPDNAISITQSIDFPTLYVAKHKQLKAETQAEQSKLDVLKSDLASEVTSVYWQLVYEQQRIRLLAQRDSVLDIHKQLADKKFQAGETHRMEVLLAEKVLRENQLEMVAARSEADGVKMQLARLLNMDATTVSNYASIVLADTLLQPLGMVQTSYNYQQSPEGIYANDRLAVASKAVTVAKNGYAPSLSLSLRNQLVISGWNPYHQDRSKFDGGNFMGFEIGVGVPLFFGATRAKVKAARKDREILELEIKEEQRQREMEYLEALNKCNAAFAHMAYYQQDGEKKADELSRLAILEYQNGEISYSEYINVLQESIDIRMKHLSAINDYNQSVIALRRLTNGKFF